MERFFDVLFSSFALLLLTPLLMPVGFVLKFSGEGEVFYLQERVGKNGKIFKLFKFATMLKNSPNIGTGTVTIKDDPRVLPVGKFLRKTKINELPQLLNIFIGDMSLIGPRPLTIQTFNFYSPDIRRVILTVRPGLSGIGSIVFRNEEEVMQDASAPVDFYAKTIAPYKGALEEWFVTRAGLYLYFMAIVVTAWSVIFPKSKIAWRVFKDLPDPPAELKQAFDLTV